MPGRSKDKVAVVTGGATGIGEAISKKFPVECAKVLVCGLPLDPVEEVVNEIKHENGEAATFEGDMSEAVNSTYVHSRSSDWLKFANQQEFVIGHSLRHLRFLGLRRDKNAKEVVREKAG